MKLTELINTLSEHHKQYGDIEVFYVSGPDDDGDEVVLLEGVFVAGPHSDGSNSILLTHNYYAANCPKCSHLCTQPEDDGGYICENQECQNFFEIPKV